MVTATISSARIPKFQMPKIVVGSSAAMTASMILPVESLDLICGLDDTFIKSLIALSSYFLLAALVFLRSARTILRMDLIAWVSWRLAGQT